MSILSQNIGKDIAVFLRSNSRIFFNEKEFQLELASYLKGTGNYFKVYMEYTIPSSYIKKMKLKNFPWTNSDLRIDIVVEKNNEFVPIELKYKTKQVVGLSFNRFGQNIGFALKSQAAQDVGRYLFWKDVRRIEVLKHIFERKINEGFVVFLTNDMSYKSSGQGKSYDNFSLDGSAVNNIKWNTSAKWVKKYPDFILGSSYSIVWLRSQNLFFYSILTVQ